MIGSADRQPSTEDAAIRAMLVARADRAPAPNFDLATLVAVAGRQVRSRPVLAPAARRWASFAAVGVALAVVAVVAIPQTSHPAPGSSGASPMAGSPSAASERPSSAPPGLSEVRIATPAEVGDLARTQSAELATRLVAVRGMLDIVLDPACADPGCRTATLADAGGGFVVRLSGSFATVGSATLPTWRRGAFVLRFTAEARNGQPVMDVVGDLATATDGGLTLTVADVIAGRAGSSGALVAIDGWLVRTPDHPCDPSHSLQLRPSDAASYGCPENDYLTDGSFQPAQDRLVIRSPDVGLLLPSGSYDLFAPNATLLGSGGFEPRRAVFVLAQRVEACGVGEQCWDGSIVAPDLGGVVRYGGPILGRLEPVLPPVVVINPAAPTLPPPTPITDGVPPPSGDAWTVSELLAAQWPVMQEREFVVRGWLVATPAMRCLLERPIPSGLPDYSCGEADWLTDDRFQAWSADGSTGSARAPGVGIRVQNGAYQGFAANPVTAVGGGLEPSFGLWLVRFAVHSTCEYGGAAPQDCAGGPVFTWEIVGRLPSPKLPLYPGGMGGVAEPALPPSVTPAPAGY